MLKIKELRLSKGVSQQKVADFLNVSQQAYANYESGKRKPEYDLLLRLADFFDVSVDYILGRTDTKKAPASKRDEREEEFVEMFKHLNPEQQDLVIAQLKGILDTHKK